MNVTRGNSCVLCQQRKVRCDQQKPCANCVKAQVECRVLPPLPPRRRRKKKKLKERDLIERLKKYEALLSQHGIHFDSIQDGGEDVPDLELDHSGLKASPGGSTQQERNAREDERRTKSFAYYKEYRTTDDMLYDSSDEEHRMPTINRAFDTMFSDCDGFPFVVGGLPARITSLHPPAIQIFQLWQLYINNVNPLLKISHVPTLQVQIIAAGADPPNISKPLEALMFSIYLIAVTSMTDDEVWSTFCEDKAVLLARYHEGTQQALINAGFMRSTDLMVLQAYFLYLFSAGQYSDPRSLFCLIGIAVRIATRLGLHRDTAPFGLAPFETEQRRRLWWQIVTLDQRVAEITGSAITTLSSAGPDCQLPLNVNDTDLHPQSKEPPTPYAGTTEMSFCLTRIELTIAASPISIRPSPGILNKSRANHTPSSMSTEAIGHLASQPPPHNLDSYCAYMESVYLRHCNPKIPIQLFTLMMARTALCKLRITDFLCRDAPTTDLDERERDSLFIAAIQMLEDDNVIFDTKSLHNFLWYTHLQAPLTGSLFLVSELRQRTTGELCERAWKAIGDNHDKRDLGRNARSPMQVAFGQMLIKAWSAHEEAELSLGKTVQPPKLVSILCQQFSSNTSRHQTAPDLAEDKDARSDSNTTVVATGDTGADGKSVPDRMGQATGMMFDENMTFPSSDGMNQMYDAALGDYNQMDWAYLMQFGGLGGLYNGSGPSFAQGNGFYGHPGP